ncbi:MAG TPA: hypothetical protein DCP32_08160 [Anaerolineaceae bacterium]|nr:MAG: hypothetical protein A2X24_08980 [Chloroflexi bacterium GWB2_54_36]HAL16712.1 hypothetical protein [Anaerolineaceae bacterium]
MEKKGRLLFRIQDLYAKIAKVKSTQRKTRSFISSFCVLMFNPEMGIPPLVNRKAGRHILDFLRIVG